MGLAAQLVAGRVTNPGTTLTALTVNTGDSFAVNNFPNTAQCYLDQMWAREATPGVFRIRSPRMHDASQGIRTQVGDTVPRLLLPDGADQRLYPSDTLTVEASGGGAETDNAFFLAYYTDLPGVSARLATWQEVQPRIVDIAGVEVDTTTSATAGQWSAGTAINASFDTFKANTDYALLGYLMATAVGAVAVQGVDTGNFRIGGPGAVDHIQTREYFVKMAHGTGRPYIPVINSNNKATTNLFVADPATSTAINTTLILAQLSQ
jgi:hypothetical protein